MLRATSALFALLTLLLAGHPSPAVGGDVLAVPPPGYTYAPAADCPFAGVTYTPCEDQMQRLASATDKAKAEGKLLLIVLGADWCPWCKSLEKLLPSGDVLARKDAQFDYAATYAYTNIATSAVAKGKRIAIPSGTAVETLLFGRSKMKRQSNSIPYIIVLDPKSGAVFHRGMGDLEDTFNVAQAHDVTKIRDLLRAAHAQLRP
jgi:glutaredoxin